MTTSPLESTEPVDAAQGAGDRGDGRPQQPRRWGRLPKRPVVGVGLVAAVLVFFLTQTRLPDVLAKLPDLAVGAAQRGQTAAFSPLVDPARFPDGLVWVAHGINLWDANAIGMLFAVLLGAAATAALQPEIARFRGLLGRRGALGAAVGGGLGMPLFMCSACSAPVSLGFHRGGAAIETTMGVILGSALLNPVGLLAIFALLGPQMGIARVAFALAALFALVPLVARVHERVGRGPLTADAERKLLDDTPVAAAAPGSAAPAADRCQTTPARAADDTWRAATADVLRAWGRASLDFAVRLVPAMAAAGFAVGAVLQFAPVEQLSDTVTATVLAVVVTAAVGTLLQLPTLFEIPLVFGVLALGLGTGPAAALLVTAPSVGLVTLAVVRRDLGWATPALLMAGTFGGGLVVGLIAAVL